MTHPHKDLIIALLDDPMLEVEQVCRQRDVYKADIHMVMSDQLGEYKFRIKEKPKPDVVLDLHAHLGPFYVRPSSYADEQANLRLTFSADGVLKNAEVL